MASCSACGGNMFHLNSCRYRAPLSINATASQRAAYDRNKDMFKKKSIFEDKMMGKVAPAPKPKTKPKAKPKPTPKKKK